MRFPCAPKRFAFLAVFAILAAPASAEWPKLWPSKTDDANTPPAEEQADGDALVDTSFFKVSWPKVQMPKIDWKPGFGLGGSGAQGSGENPVSRALDRVATGSRQAADRVRNAWGSTVGALTPGGGGSRQTADNEPGFWSRMFTPEEPKRPLTTTEFVAQDRPGMSR